GGDDEPVWDGTLNKGENYRFTAAAWDTSDVGTYHVTSIKPVGTVVNCYDDNGASFFPVINSQAIGIVNDFEPSGELETVSLVGSEVVLRYANYPDGLHADVFDASGRKVSEIVSPRESGKITWGQDHGPGVYFIKVDDTRSDLTRKVVITR
ncbi:T9SS type A sorting domain-containing protein, partial [candidate division WOR-3 bacterium]|nr:T9SS type A sorting domain-containing protein [candidate division WOR-3 bacterium]MBD3363580.1 T9SS type A sorting domain-containing protein [candidate division WOR-3 bacterium]